MFFARTLSGLCVLTLALTGCTQSAQAPVPPARAVQAPAPAPAPHYVSYRESSFNAPATVSIGALPLDRTGEAGFFPGEPGPGVFYGDSGVYGVSNHDYYFRHGSSYGGWGYGGCSPCGRSGYITITPQRTATIRR